MKAIKLLPLFLFTLLSQTFTACSDDDNNGSDSSIVGVWEYSEYYSDDDYYIETIEFKSNGKYIASEVEYYNDELYTDSWTGTYRYKDGWLTVIEEDGDDFVLEATVTSKKLILTDEDGDSVTFTKVE